MNFSSKLRDLFNLNEVTEPKIATLPRGKRKHDKISSGIIFFLNKRPFVDMFDKEINQVILRQESFLPEFPFRDDVCISDFNVGIL